MASRPLIPCGTTAAPVLLSEIAGRPMSAVDRQAGGAITLNIHTDAAHYRPSARAALSEILRPLLNTRSREENRSIYGPVVDVLRLVDDPAQADVHVLPMSWQHYLRTGTQAATAFSRRVAATGKPLIVWVSEDIGVRVPIEDAWRFSQAGYRSLRAPRQYALPVFISDPLADDRPNAVPRPWNPVPLIGFCGQAGDSIWSATSKSARAFVHNLKSALRLSQQEGLPLLPPTVLRARVLDALERSPLVRTNFVRHRKYHAGSETAAQRAAAREAFIDNVLGSDYTVCVRGTGNFSARLYETLALGRIPVFIDTDCLLPWDDVTDWKQYCVWVNAADVSCVAEHVAAFHERLGPGGFGAQQQRCREFWFSHLSFNGYFTRFAGQFAGSSH